MKTLIWIKETLVRSLEWILIALVIALVLDVLWQVATRYLLRDPSSWTDELATLLMIWVALLGASVAFIKRAHLGVNFVVEKLGVRWQFIVEIVVNLLVAFFAVVILIYGGAKLAVLAWLTEQVSPALGIQMAHVYLALPLSGVFVLIFAMESMAERWHLRAWKTRGNE